MKNILVLTTVLLALLSFGSWTLNDQETVDNTFPTTTTPPAMVGEWASGYSSHTQVTETYNCDIPSASEQSRYLKITPDGRNAALYLTSQSQSSTFATQMTGTIRFDAESTNSRGSFTFLALKVHLKGFGSSKIDRDATEEELKKIFTRKYYYRMDGDWLRIEPNGEPNDFSSSFRKLE